MTVLVLSMNRLTEDTERKLQESNQSITFVFASNDDEIKTAIKKAEVILTYGEDLTEEHINEAKQLKWIMVLSAGLEKMPFDAIRKRDITLTNVRGIHKVQMSEYALAMLLNHYRQTATLHEQQKERMWKKDFSVREITGRTMTIVGAGAIGEELARLAQAFRMTTIAVSNSGGQRNYFDESYTNSQFKQAVEKADFVISILPSTPDTKYYYKETHFKQMKNEAVFLNMGRGDAVDSELLIRMLDEQEIEHAILDVTPVEPLPQDHPIWDHQRITLTPHVSGKSIHYVTRAIDIFEQNLKSYLEGNDLTVNKIDLSRGY